MLLRSIELNDLPTCSELLKRIWDFSGFSHPMGEEATAAWYLHHHLQPSTHAFVLENDLPTCSELLKRIWDFSGFSHPMGEEATAAWYLHHHLQPSTHAFVLELNGLVVGYLLGTIPGDRTFDSKPEWKCIGHQVEDTWQAVTTAEERQTFLNEWFYGGTWAEEVLKRKAISKDASVWIQLFIVDPEVQGQGLGSRLWKAFEEVRIKWAEEVLKRKAISKDASVWIQLFIVDPEVQGQGLGSRLWKAFEEVRIKRASEQWVLLHTDTWCGFQFYERRGLVRVQGQGLGSRLWKAFEEVRIKRASEQWVLLHTDTWCGFQFYERRGLVRLGTCPVKELPIDANGVQPAYFLYGLRPTCLRV